MRFAFVFILMLMAGLANSTRTDRPPYPQTFEVRGCPTEDGRDAMHPTVQCKDCDWIRTGDGWIASCRAN